MSRVVIAIKDIDFKGLKKGCAYSVLDGLTDSNLDEEILVKTSKGIQPVWTNIEVILVKDGMVLQNVDKYADLQDAWDSLKDSIQLSGGSASVISSMWDKPVIDLLNLMAPNGLRFHCVKPAEEEPSEEPQGKDILDFLSTR